MNKMKMEFDAVSDNEGFARVCVAAFVTRLDPTLEEINDVKTAVSEAVTNCVIHAYRQKGGTVYLEAAVEDRTLYLTIRDEGCGIADVNQAMMPLYTTDAEHERSGMGFTFMEVFMDELEVESKIGVGTTIKMTKRFGVPQE